MHYDGFLLLDIHPINAVVGGEDLSWQAYANCLGVDPDLFFPERGASTREAKAVCSRCVVRTECLEYALNNAEKFGIWGGLSERERRRIRKLRAQQRRNEKTNASSDRKVARAESPSKPTAGGSSLALRKKAV